MYFLAHLLAGILLGILLAFLFRESMLIPACALGSILPDLIDKPVGLLLFPETLGYGRIFFHSLLIAGLILFVGIIVYLKYPRAGLFLLAVAAGVFTHQILDAMWLQPDNWYWPAFGPFRGHSRDDFFLDAFWRTITNPTEWLAGVMILIIMIILLIPRYRNRFLPGHDETGARRSSLIPLFLIVVAVIALILSIGIFYE